MKLLGHVSNVYLHPKIHEYAEKLTDRFPGNLKVQHNNIILSLFCLEIRIFPQIKIKRTTFALSNIVAK